MSLLYKRQPLVISPQLAVRIGLNEAVVLQQICYWLEETTAGVEHEGRKWVYNTIEEWNKQFPFWAHDTVKRTLTSLKKSGLLAVKQLNKAQHDRTNFYAINYDCPLLTDEGKLHPSKGAKGTPSKRAETPPSKGAESTLLHTEITTETTAENFPGAENSAPAGVGTAVAVVLPKQQQVDQTETAFQMKCRACWDAYKAAYAHRYQAAPIRNAKVNALVKQLVQRLGDEAAPVADFFVSAINEAYVVRNCHDLGALVAKAESYRTQWVTGRAMTTGQARQIDSTQTNANAADQAKAILKARREREGRE